MQPDPDKFDSQLILEEGLRLAAYEDTKGIKTIGVGHNLIAAPLTAQQIAICGSNGLTGPISHAGAIYVLHNDQDLVYGALNAHTPWWNNLDEIRSRVLADLCFNMGWGTLCNFHHFLYDLEQNDFVQAAIDLQASAWYDQVGNRGKRLVTMMNTGEDYTS